MARRKKLKKSSRPGKAKSQRLEAGVFLQWIDGTTEVVPFSISILPVRVSRRKN